jgi:hypothetical protein
MSINDGFWDLTPEERGAAYEHAEEAAGMPPGSFWDLTPEERGRAYERASGLYGRYGDGDDY